MLFIRALKKLPENVRKVFKITYNYYSIRFNYQFSNLRVVIDGVFNLLAVLLVAQPRTNKVLLLCRAAFQRVGPQYVLVRGVIPSPGASLGASLH